MSVKKEVEYTYFQCTFYVSDSPFVVLNNAVTFLKVKFLFHVTNALLHAVIFCKCCLLHAVFK